MKQSGVDNIKIFLFITISTHLRVMMEVANLLQLSGKYEPIIVYYPAAVFQQNYFNCQSATHTAFIWTGKGFLSKTDYIAYDSPVNTFLENSINKLISCFSIDLINKAYKFISKQLFSLIVNLKQLLLKTLNKILSKVKELYRIVIYNFPQVLRKLLEAKAVILFSLKICRKWVKIFSFFPSYTVIITALHKFINLCQMIIYNFFKILRIIPKILYNSCRRFGQWLPIIPLFRLIYLYINNLLLDFIDKLSNILHINILTQKFMRKYRNASFFKAFSNQSWQRRFLIYMFAVEWACTSSSPKEGHKESYCKRIFKFLCGNLGEIEDQKIFYQGVTALIKKLKPALCVLPEENLFYNSQFIVRAAHLNTIPVIIVPFTIVNTLEWAEAFFDVPLYQANIGFNKIVSKAFPHWILQHRGRYLILPPVYVLGCEYFDIVPNNPWLINDGKADIIAVENRFMYDYYLRAGIKKEKLYMTGSLADDQIYSLLLNQSQNRKMLEKRFDILIKGKIILIGLPPNQFGAGKRRNCEFNTYKALIKFIVDTICTLSANNATVLINLHPRVNPSEVMWLEDCGAKIILEPIERLVPLSDIYVSVSSATIRLGVSSGIPVINYDAYQYNYDDYKSLEGVCEVKTKNAYKTIVNALINEQVFYANIKSKQEQAAKNLCLVDGRSGQRLLELFDKTICIGANA